MEINVLSADSQKLQKTQLRVQDLLRVKDKFDNNGIFELIDCLDRSFRLASMFTTYYIPNLMNGKLLEDSELAEIKERIENLSRQVNDMYNQYYLSDIKKEEVIA